MALADRTEGPAHGFFSPFEQQAIAASASEIARLARKGIREGDGFTPIRALFKICGPMIYDPEAIAALSGVHVGLVCAMARLGYLSVYDGWVVSICE